MKLRIQILTVLAVLLLSSSAFASIYATTVEDYDLGTGITSDASRYIPASSLGAPDGTFYSLGLGGSLLLSFGQSFDTSVSVFEITYGDRSGYLETADVYVGNTKSLSLGDFTFAGDINNSAVSSSVNLTSLSGSYLYVLIVDTTPGSGKDGFDVDAVAVNPTPIPGAAWLLGTGLLGLLGLRRSTKR